MADKAQAFSTHFTEQMRGSRRDENNVARLEIQRFAAVDPRAYQVRRVGAPLASELAPDDEFPVAADDLEELPAVLVEAVSEQIG